MTWDKTFPQNSDFLKKSPKPFRDNWEAIENTFETDHRVPGTRDQGEHNKVTFYEPISTPTNAANKGFLYGKDVDSKIELHFLDESNNELQLTSKGRKVPRTTFIWWNGTVSETQVVPSGSATVAHPSTGVYTITLNEETNNYLTYSYMIKNSSNQFGQQDDGRRGFARIQSESSGGGQTVITLRTTNTSGDVTNFNWKLEITQAS